MYDEVIRHNIFYYRIVSNVLESGIEIALQSLLWGKR